MGKATTTVSRRVRATMAGVISGATEVPGEVIATVRRAAFRWAHRLCGIAAGERLDGPTPPLPAALENYVDKVARHAYRVTDDDIASLRAQGYGEASIFELTVATAAGAAVGRLHRALAVLDEAVENLEEGTMRLS